MSVELPKVNIPAKGKMDAEMKKLCDDIFGDTDYKKEYNYINDVTSPYSNLLMVYGSHNDTQRYTYGLDVLSVDLFKSVDTFSTSITSGKAQRIYYLQDELGSPIKLLDESGKVKSNLAYDAFGKPLFSAYLSEIKARYNIFAYTGYQYDDTTGLMYAQARYYMPEVGRFISEDAYKGIAADTQSLNWYVYCNGNPVGFVDPSGNYYIVKNKSGLYSIKKENKWFIWIKSISNIIIPIPFLDTAIAKAESEVFGVVDGNSKTSGGDGVLEDGKDITFKMLEDVASSVGKKILKFIDIGVQGYKTYKAYDILRMDSIAFNLMNNANVSTECSDKDSLQDIMNKTYSFIESGKNYFTTSLGDAFNNNSLYDIDLVLANAKDSEKLIAKYKKELLKYCVFDLGYNSEYAECLANGIMFELDLDNYQSRLTDINLVYSYIIKGN